MTGAGGSLLECSPLPGIWGFVDFEHSPNIPRIREVFSHFPLSPNALSTDRIAVGPSPDRLHAHLIITADVQLHNRPDLLNRLPVDNHPHLSDAQLVLAAYEKWGEECPSFLLGEFAFAIWDGKRKRLFCCRDHIGVRPFNYWSNGARSLFAFASRRHTLLSIPGVPRQLNFRKFANTTVFRGYHHYHDETFHAQIMSLPQGCSLTVDEHGVKRQTYWTPEIRPELVPQRPQEVFEALRELLFEAVRCRLPEHGVSAELSGGLDSSSITAITANILEGRGQDLMALSAVLPKGEQKFADEREFIEQFRERKNIRIEYVTAPGQGPFDAINEPARFEESPIRSSRLYLYDAMERAAVHAGAEVVLQGTLGELGPTCRAVRYFTELAVKLRWVTFFRELRQMRKTQGNSALHRVVRQFLYLLPPLTERPTPYVLLQADFARLSSHTREQVLSSSPWQRDHQLSVIRNFLRGTGLRTGQTPRGYIRTTNPLLDKRVLEFCLAAPPETKVRNGYPRYLVRGSLEGILPERIRWRTDKVPFSPDYSARYNAQFGKAQEFVAAIRPNDPIRSVIDVTGLARSMETSPPDVDSRTTRTIVPGTIYAVCFLRQFPEFRL